ncbi:F0F1 ATP synthase subunit delta [Candidatus Symbiobacter mobilis]|uniref:ATP synthase subunit delta n=1 Tax=Candidatus Symbiobacter mobilis CR TaxID=946483 RepID=U5NCB1_9BURK|nr:F0F1 ATP synthase subunit delta [Candidatus Symbiobacter mobilis]AGX87843.1 F-type proton-transporting ATPase subunit delta [Candidatus Symbiobacter mobilis CR]
MAEVATIARPYAQALYASYGADAQSALAWLDEFALIASQPALLAFAQNPHATAEQIFDVIATTMRSTLEDRARNFLRIVIANHRLPCLADVASQFRTLVHDGLAVSEATVYSAFPIEAERLQALGALLEHRFARKLLWTVQVQPELIGGIRVVVGDEVLDVSVRARLDQMRAALMA